MGYKKEPLAENCFLTCPELLATIMFADESVPATAGAEGPSIRLLAPMFILPEDKVNVPFIVSSLPRMAPVLLLSVTLLKVVLIAPPIVCVADPENETVAERGVKAEVLELFSQLPFRVML